MFASIAAPRRAGFTSVLASVSVLLCLPSAATSALFGATTLAALAVAPGQLDGQQVTTEALPVEHTIAVRTVALDDDDFSDLEPLAHLIGTARVVALGEGSHGAGSDFRAKARLVRFLHEHMGFDVLLWEAGIYDMRYVAAAIESGAPPRQAAQEGLYIHWAAASEVVSLLEYLQDERRAGQPIEIEGFDLQVSRPLRNLPRLIEDLLLFFEAGDRSLLSPDLRQRLENLYRRAAAIAASAERSDDERASTDSLAPTYRELQALAPRLLHATDGEAEALGRRHAPRQIAFVRQMLKSLEGLNRIDEPLPGDADRPRWDFVRRWNEREIVNAANIEWYANHRYSDRKIVIWAHNAHVVEGFLTSDFSVFSETPPDSLQIRPSGSLIRMALGRDLFSLIFTAYEGAVGRITDAVAGASNTIRLEPAPDGSIETQLHRSGQPYAVLPLRSAVGELEAWLREPRAGRIDTEFLDPQTLDWRRVADAMFFIDHVEPSTLRSRRGEVE